MQGCWCTNISTMEFRIMASQSYALPWISYLEGLDKGSSWDNNGVKQTRFLLWVYYDLKEAILKQVDRQVQGFEKRNDEKALELMNAYVVAVLDELTTLYLHIDVVLKKKDQLDQRGARSAFHHLYYTT
ncbi:hypothetical protein Hanom_Chr09g00828151 [Helianthus anomalus]